MSAKMDGVYTRTPQQLEQKVDYSKRFAEVMGIATDARNAADKAKNSVKHLDEALTAEKIYNRLTNNGQLQGLFRDDKGNLYINGSNIRALEELFAKDIKMSGTFTHTAKVFIEPDQEVVNTIQKHLISLEIIPMPDFPLYDFNNDGNITSADLVAAQKAAIGAKSLAGWSGAVKTDVTLTIDLKNSEKFLRIQGKNMWGRQVDKYIGVNFTNIKNTETEQKLDEVRKDYIVESGWVETGWYGEKWASGKAVCWGRTEAHINMESPYGEKYYTTHSITLPSDFFINLPIFADVKSLSDTGLIDISICELTKSTIKFFVSNAQQSILNMDFMVKAIGMWK